MACRAMTQWLLPTGTAVHLRPEAEKSPGIPAENGED